MTSLKPDDDEFLGGQARLLRLADSIDQRGKLLPIPFAELPFVPRRCFCVSQVPAGTVRGKHAHRESWQLLICLNGRIDVLMRDGHGEATVQLTDDSSALLIAPLIWTQQTYLTDGAVLMVLASHEFDPGSYVTDAGALA
ncbi:MAG: FdtA/QdtA family cupin domain-containing protein [Hyphomicrobiales bacterium]